MFWTLFEGGFGWYTSYKYFNPKEARTCPPETTFASSKVQILVYADLGLFSFLPMEHKLRFTLAWNILPWNTHIKPMEGPLPADSPS